MNTETCALCERQVPRTTRHHLIPRTVHKNKWFRKRFSKEKLHETIDLCRDCHRQLHRFIGHKELGRHYNTREKLLQHEKMRKFVSWLKRRE